MNKRDIVIRQITYLRGPNIWTYCATLEALIDIGELEDCPSNTVPGLYERLTTMLPSLIEHRCSPGVRGGFLMRLKEGTWPCHIIEHVTLALQDLAGVPGYGFGRARETEERGVYKVMVSGWQEDVTRAALYTARDLVLAAIENKPYDFDGALDSTRSGILYLSETVSKIIFEKPNNLKERIVASKVSGNNNGFSYNTARSTAYDFYNNTVPFGLNMISPIADTATSHGERARMGRPSGMRTCAISSTEKPACCSRAVRSAIRRREPSTPI